MAKRGRVENLKPFKPGQSGNPKGRPKGQGITDRILRRLNEDDGKLAEDIAEVIIKKAKAGDFNFCKTVLERIDGKIPDRIAGADGGSLKIIIQGIDDDGSTDQD